MNIRPASERGRADYGWLDSRHTFSFGNYYDPKHMGFRALRVINDDRVTAGAGFPTHGHRDMEILSYVVEGALEHKDSMGNGSLIRPGEIQRMSAGRGVTHSEYNPSSEVGTRFLQIWIQPERKGLAPGYEQRAFDPEGKQSGLRLIASRDGRDDSITVHQDLSLYRGVLSDGQTSRFELDPTRHLWLQVVRGTIRTNALRLAEGDGASLSGPATLTLQGENSAEFLLFDLA